MIDVKDLTKRYGNDPLALRGISFSVPRGQVVGFLGPNGAGKTTTMKILTGFLAPTSGTAVVAGHDMTSDPLPALRRIGYLPTDNPLYGELRVEEILRFAADMHGLKGAQKRSAMDAAIAAVGLSDRRRQRAHTLSTGYRQRVGLAQALLHRPDVLILDEPTYGLDPNQQQEILALIRELGRERTVMISTHILSEVEQVCDRALIIDRGLIVADGSVDEIRAGRRAAIVLVARATAEAAREAFGGIPGVTEVDVAPVAGAPAHVRVRLSGTAEREACEEAAARAAGHGLALSSLAPEVASLEQVFAELTAGAEQPAGEVARA